MKLMATFRSILVRCLTPNVFSSPPSHGKHEDGVRPHEPGLEADLDPGVYWHSTDAHPTNFLFQNVWIGQGRLNSMSAVRREHGERPITLGELYPLAGAYAETIWEEVRTSRYPDKPSRRGALFLFAERAAAVDAADWRPGSERLVCKVRVLRNATMHRGDLGWFDRQESDWYEAAAAYWSGAAASASPCWEYVVDGQVYFPAWREPPFKQVNRGEICPKNQEIVICPVCGIEFTIVSANGTTFNALDRSRCAEDPDLPILSDCPNVAAAVEAAWGRFDSGKPSIPRASGAEDLSEGTLGKGFSHKEDKQCSDC